MHDEFLCHVTAYGVCGGRRIGVPLGTYRAPTLALALWWLRDRASWIAERLDPTPEAAPFPAGALVPVAETVADVPALLHAWFAHDGRSSVWPRRRRRAGWCASRRTTPPTSTNCLPSPSTPYR